MSIIEINAEPSIFEEFGPTDGRPVARARLHDGRPALAVQAVSARLASRGPAVHRSRLRRWARIPKFAAPRGRSEHPRCRRHRRRHPDRLGPARRRAGRQRHRRVVTQLVAVHHPERIGALVLTSCDAFEHFPPPILKPLIVAARNKGSSAPPRRPSGSCGARGVRGPGVFRHRHVDA